MNAGCGSEPPVLDIVRERYGRGAIAPAPELCCPVDFDAQLLAVLPREILERDYGCGDPSRFVREGDAVLDLGSGAGKVCYVASQLAGPRGRVVGVDATPEMLALARSHLRAVGDRIGWHNVEFRHGHIQDLALDRDRLAAWVARHPVRDLAGVEALRREEERLRREEPMVADESVDLVLSNCVLNLVDNRSKETLFAEIHRVLRRGGRCAISDIVSDEDVPLELQRDPELWTRCISGSMREDRFLDAFAHAGFYGIEIADYKREPWSVVNGIEFRSMTVVAWKGEDGPSKDHRQAVIYNGPWKRVEDDDGMVLERGTRTAVSRKSFEMYTREPYADHVTAVPPRAAVESEDAPDFDPRRSTLRDPRETKAGVALEERAGGSSCCEPSASCH